MENQSGHLAFFGYFILSGSPAVCQRCSDGVEFSGANPLFYKQSIVKIA